MSGKSDNDISDSEMMFFLRKIGFEYKRTSGDHFQFGFTGVPEQVNLQPRNSQIKPYQVQQVRKLVQKYGLGCDNDEL